MDRNGQHNAFFVFSCAWPNSIARREAKSPSTPAILGSEVKAIRADIHFHLSEQAS